MVEPEAVAKGAPVATVDCCRQEVLEPGTEGPARLDLDADNVEGAGLS